MSHKKKQTRKETKSEKSLRNNESSKIIIIGKSGEGKLNYWFINKIGGYRNK